MYGQVPSWKVTPTGLEHRLIFPSGVIFMANSKPMEPGNYLGAFYDSSGVDVCIGKSIFTNTGDTMIVYGSDSPVPPPNGISNGEPIILKVWDKNLNCVYFNANVSFSSGKGEFQAEESSVVSAIFVQTTSVKYYYDRFCFTSAEMPGITIPEISPGFNQITFVASPAGLSIDQLTGKIDLASSEKGNYIIKVVGDECVLQNTIEMSIVSEFSDDDNILSQELACNEDSLYLNVGEEYFTGGIAPFSYLIEDVYGVSTSTSQVVDLQLVKGEYILRIEDASSCYHTVSISVSTEDDCGPIPTDFIDSIDEANERNVLTPLLTGERSSIEIGCGGFKVFNRFGQLEYESDETTSWNGRNQNEIVLPTGQFVIFCGEERWGEVTIVR